MSPRSGESDGHEDSMLTIKDTRTVSEKVLYTNKLNVRTAITHLADSASDAKGQCDDFQYILKECLKTVLFGPEKLKTGTDIAAADVE